MKTKQTISKIAATAILAVASIAPGIAQSNLGVECGCPPPASRTTTVNLSSLATAATPADPFGSPDFILNANTTLDCSKTWILDCKLYVPAGLTLTITPGTVIKGKSFATTDSSSCLFIQQGGQIQAAGTATCPIVFTAVGDNLDGTYPVANHGKWGGILLAGKATNNLTLAANGPVNFAGKLCRADGIGVFEGFHFDTPRNSFGVTPGSFDDNDNSGTLKYVSIRHAGTILSVGAEINSLTLGSVGRGTTLEHIDIVSGGDDGIEFFGGTANIKYLTLFAGNDDNLDWDDGYSGRVQFVFSLKTTNTASTANDNGIEADADDQKSNLLPRSHPIVANATFIGNLKDGSGGSPIVSDESALAAINAKELTEGEIYSSVFANYFRGFNIVQATGSRTGGFEAYNNWTATGTQTTGHAQSLKVVCNTFVGNTTAFTIDKSTAAILPADNTQFTTTDKNVVAATIPGFTFALTIDNNTNIVSTPKIDAVPSPALSVTGCPNLNTIDPFFTNTSYRGAFAPTGKPWISDWSYNQLIGTTAGIVPCPTDINGDGSTTNADLSQLLLQFGQSCN